MGSWLRVVASGPRRRVGTARAAGWVLAFVLITGTSARAIAAPDEPGSATLRQAAIDGGAGVEESADPGGSVTAEPSAADRDLAKRHFDAAQALYRAGRFSEAFDAYHRAYELAPFPDLLFNMAQCRRNLRDLEGAILHFREFTRRATSAADRGRVEALILELERELEALRGRAPTEPEREPERESERERPRGAAARELPRALAAPALAEARTATRATWSPPEGVAEDGGTAPSWVWWAALAGVVVAGGAALAVALGTAGDPEPRGTIGTIDAR